MKKENGITLIALVITIIVMLILAGVVVAMLTGQGNIIRNAENVVGEYNNSVTEEQELLNTIEKYFENYLGGNEETIVDSTVIANNPSEYYGGEVTNYTTPSGDPNVKWRIFYADESNIYLIASDYIHYDYCPTGANGTTVTRNSDYRLSFNNAYQDYTGLASITDARIRKWIQKYLDVAPSSTNSNIRAVAFMLDETRWSAKYANPSYAEYAIGGPTLEMFVASYNKTHEPPMYCSANATGYYISWTEGGTDYLITGLDTSESLYVISDTSKAYAMWLGSPSAHSANYLASVYYGGYVNYYHFYRTSSYDHPGFRPLVCLNSDVQLEKQSDGTYLIK